MKRTVLFAVCAIAATAVAAEWHYLSAASCRGKSGEIGGNQGQSPYFPD
jgi:hypothetical protein